MDVLCSLEETSELPSSAATEVSSATITDDSMQEGCIRAVTDFALWVISCHGNELMQKQGKNVICKKSYISVSRGMG